MLHPRIIVCLLIHKKGLVKTVHFKNPKYVGDPINAVKIFNEKKIDELMVIDIDASVENREPDYKMIENIAVECRMPLCYGGGIKTKEQAKRVFNLGVEKISLSSTVFNNIDSIKEITSEVGKQSVVIVLDIKKKLFGNYEIFINNGLTKTGMNPIQFIKTLESIGVGEIVINSIDYDGSLKGFDFSILDKIIPTITTPVTILGGASSLENIGEAIKKYGRIGIAAGSLFVFKGKYKAVLINYPNPKEKIELINQYLTNTSL